MSNATNRISRRTFIKSAALVAGGTLLAACGGAAAPQPTTAPVQPTAGPTTAAATAAPTAAPQQSGPQALRLGVWADVQDASVYSQMLLNFMNKHKDIQVTMEQYPGDYYAKMQANFAAGNPADVLYYQGWIMPAYADSGVIMPLDDIIASANLGSKFYNGTNYENLTKWHGKTYMTPTDVGSLCVFYNKDLFDKRQVPYPKKGWSWTDFQQAIQKLSFEENGTKYYGWAQAGGWNGSYGRVDAFMRRNGYLEWDRVIEPKKALWNNPDIYDTLQFLIYDAIKNNWSPSPDVIAGGGVGVDTGRCAMVFEGPWYLPQLWGDLATMKDKGGINFDVEEPPVGTANKNTTFGHVHGHCIASVSKNVSGATQLITYMLSDEGQTVIANGGRMPGLPGNINKIWGPIVTKKYHFKNIAAFSNGMREGSTPIIMGQGTELNAYGGGPINKLWDQLLGLQKPAKDATAFSLALMLNRPIRAQGIYRTIYYLPAITPAVASAVVWVQILNPDTGVLNAILGVFGFAHIKWLFDPVAVIPAFILMSLWFVGPQMIIFLAGLQGVPRELIEAAEIDGANTWQRFWNITVPMVSPIIFFNLVVGIIGTFQVFTQTYVMTRGGPQDQTRFMALYIYQNGFEYFRMGYAALLSWVLFGIVLFFTVIQFRLATNWVFYER